MPKRKYFVSVSILIVYILLCCYITYDNISFTNISIGDIVLKGSKPREIPIAKLEIKKLGINRYIYNFNSSYNTVEKNISILKESILPDHDNSIVFLAAHSGNSKISYFNNLGNLGLNDIVHFYYNNYKYSYQTTKIYEVKKNGYIGINKNTKKQLILTTCSTKHKRKQLIVESILIKKEKYHI
ncbi:MAG: sortase [Bacilli bacterium]|nr:sortase [Bacilli bacterium]